MGYVNVTFQMNESPSAIHFTANISMSLESWQVFIDDIKKNDNYHMPSRQIIRAIEEVVADVNKKWWREVEEE